METEEKKSLLVQVYNRLKNQLGKFKRDFEPICSPDSSQDIIEFGSLSPEEAGQQVITTVETCFKNLEELEKKIKDARNKAQEAKTSANKAQEKKINCFGGGKTKAIEALQEVVVNQSKAEIALVESQELLFQQQQVLAQCTKTLFALCCMNIQCAEIAVKRISECLEGAGRKKISTVAEQELLRFVQQLKSQISIYDRFENFKSVTEKNFEDCQVRLKDIETKQESIEVQLTKFNEKLEASHAWEKDIEAKQENVEVQIKQFEEKIQADHDLVSKIEISQNKLILSQQKYQKSMTLIKIFLILVVVLQISLAVFIFLSGK